MTERVFMALGTIDDVLANQKRQYFSQMQSAISHWDYLKQKDIIEFESLLKQMLCVDSKDRITPEEALNHNFISMNHLSKSEAHPYVRSAHRLMSVCQDTENGKSATTNNKTDHTETSTDISAFSAAKLTAQKSAETQNTYELTEREKQSPAQNSPKKHKTQETVIHVKPYIPVDTETNSKASEWVVESSSSSGGKNMEASTKPTSCKKKKVPRSSPVEKTQHEVQLPAHNTPRILKPQETVIHVKPCSPVENQRSKRPLKVETETNIKAPERIVESSSSSGGKNMEASTKPTSCRKKKVPRSAAAKNTEREEQSQAQNSPKKRKTQETVIHVKPYIPVETETNSKASEWVVESSSSSGGKNMEASTKPTSCKKKKVPRSAAVEKTQHEVQLPAQNSPRILKPQETVIHVKPYSPVEIQGSKRPLKVETEINIKVSERIVESSSSSGGKNMEASTKPTSCKKKKVPRSVAVEKTQHEVQLPAQNSKGKTKKSFMSRITALFSRIWPFSKK
ncbi:mucin-17-like [Oryzias latipes]|uniref:mucin-17-like n=1 Tax=Oryzias latipes TaxID=8090 RepID=UPI000CE256A9|nr:mucin-17-like [Oryzias latipes]